MKVEIRKHIFTLKYLHWILVIVETKRGDTVSLLSWWAILVHRDRLNWFFTPSQSDSWTSAWIASNAVCISLTHSLFTLLSSFCFAYMPIGMCMTPGTLTSTSVIHLFVSVPRSIDRPICKQGFTTCASLDGRSPVGLLPLQRQHHLRRLSLCATLAVSLMAKSPSQSSRWPVLHPLSPLTPLTSSRRPPSHWTPLQTQPAASPSTSPSSTSTPPSRSPSRITSTFLILAFPFRFSFWILEYC